MLEYHTSQQHGVYCHYLAPLQLSLSACSHYPIAYAGRIWAVKLSYPLCRTGLGWLLTTTASAKGNCNTSTQIKHNTCCILLSIENNYLLPILALTFCCSQLETSMAQWGKVAMSQIWSMLTDRTQVRNVRTLLSVFVQILISQTPHFITWLLT